MKFGFVSCTTLIVNVRVSERPPLSVTRTVT